MFAHEGVVVRCVGWEIDVRQINVSIGEGGTADATSSV